MKQFTISIEELLFCFYSEGFFEQGMALKQAYFPEIEDEQLGALFEAACRSLLAKDAAEYRNHQYRLKDEYCPFIHVLNDADYTVKLSKFNGQGAEQNVSCHVSKFGTYSHELLFDEQVHRITKMESSEGLLAKTDEFLHIIDTEDKRESIVTLTSNEFEKLLEGASDNPSYLKEFLEKHDHQEDVTRFTNDLALRKGKMDTLMRLAYGKDNTPEVADMAFVLPGAHHTWLVTGITQNEFSILPAHKDVVNQIISQ
ncbi:MULTISPECIES: hypothetical protein [Bacillus]|jgi:hypothetical protein|uniref:hypothetical protein n=1 Tax=Bacillus TaxID=1386 RepID=UPI000423B6A9|nr:MULTISPECIES: hypothetical protein [Bacillus]AKE22650.1 hypothetical protein BsLM_0851 [Bacillus sp. LM 4-2]KDE24808.1 hypothetical protein EF83_04310 [Bacillus subtilis]MBJ3804487.1 hypothetical protein [Bacillus subtilis]MBR0019081.1 hypothetical protein [Bacillus subtilis]MBT1089500.1 hypothetical protein [Bacillus subtilis]